MTDTLVATPDPDEPQRIDAHTVTYGTLTTNVVTHAKIQAGTVTASAIYANVITETNLRPD